MLITLDKWADQLAADVNRSNDHKFKAVIKDLIAQEYATIIKQSVDRNGYSLSLVSSITIPLMRVVNSTLELVNNRLLYITTVKVKQPLRTSSSPIPFTYVGGEDGSSSFIPTSFESVKYNKYLPLISEAVSYVYENGFIYVLTCIPIKKIKISSIFADIKDVYEEVIIDSNTTFNITAPTTIVKEKTNIELDVPIDIINLIKHKLLSEELRFQEQVKQKISDVDNN